MQKKKKMNNEVANNNSLVQNFAFINRLIIIVTVIILVIGLLLFFFDSEFSTPKLRYTLATWMAIMLLPAILALINLKNYKLPLNNINKIITTPVNRILPINIIVLAGSVAAFVLMVVRTSGDEAAFCTIPFFYSCCFFVNVVYFTKWIRIQKKH